MLSHFLLLIMESIVLYQAMLSHFSGMCCLEERVHTYQQFSLWPILRRKGHSAVGRPVPWPPFWAENGAQPASPPLSGAGGGTARPTHEIDNENCCGGISDCGIDTSRQSIATVQIEGVGGVTDLRDSIFLATNHLDHIETKRNAGIL